MNIAQAISYLYPDANPMTDFRVIVHEKFEETIEEVPSEPKEKGKASDPTYRRVIGRSLGLVQEIEHWGIDAPQPTEKELKSAWKAVQAMAYRDKRAAEYPSVGEQLDALFHAGIFPPDMAARIQSVKSKYPKS